jgi:23S rRNA U2552 (ribose-2'-O)-methylase RlmE/FtsJ
MEDLYLYKLDRSDKKKSILTYEPKIDTSIYPSQGLLTLGFHYWYIQTQNDKIRQVNIDKDFYYITNPFEIKNVERDISLSTSKIDIMTATKEYIKEDIANIEFYKLWELLSICRFKMSSSTINIISNKKNDIYETTVRLFRKKIDDVDSDNITNIIINDDISKFVNKNLYDIILCMNEIDLVAETFYKEPYIYKLLISEIVIGLSNLKKGGNIVIRIDDIFSKTTIKIIEILLNLFETVYIYKPYIIRNIHSEKFIICNNFNKKLYDETKFSKNSLQLYNKIRDNKTGYIIDIYPEYDIFSNNNLIKLLRGINCKLKNLQYKYINLLLSYINSNNYFGEEYLKYLKSQNISTDYWLSIFYPIDNKDKEKIKAIIDNKLKENMIKLN